RAAAPSLRAAARIPWLIRAFVIPRLLGVQLNHKVLVDVRKDLVPFRQSLQYSLHLFAVDLDPLRKADLARDLERGLHPGLRLRAVPHGDLVAGLDLVRRNVDDLIVHGNPAMRDELPRLGAGRREAHPVDDVVQTRLEHPQQVLARRAFDLRGLLVVVAELALEHAVHAAQLLLLAQLDAVVGQPPAALPRTARRHLELALALERFDTALQKQVRALSTGQLARRSSVSRHIATLDVASEAGSRCAVSALRPRSE